VTKPKRTRLQPLERRAQLVTCTMSAFAEHGLARGTHSHVAERAGVSVSAVHSYFRTRDDLVEVALNEVETHLLKMVLGALGGQGSVRECLTSLAAQFTESGRVDPDLFKVWLDWSTGVRADLWPRYIKLNDRFIEAAQKLLSRGKREGVLPDDLNVKAAARLFIGGGHTVALMQFAGVSKREIAIFNEHLIVSTMGMPAV
jgi:TetR/AcrR family hemagglutinin/protease transcriptional regulator